MFRQSWKIFASVSMIAIGMVILIFEMRNREENPIVDVSNVVAADLFLPWDSLFANSKEDEEKLSDVGTELSRRPINGPVRCFLRVVPGASVRQEPEVEVELRNTSDQPVTIKVYRDFLDTVTFIVRDPEGNVLSSFCHASLNSDFGGVPGPPIILGPRASQSDAIFLSTACYGFQAPHRGLYTIEAVFHQSGYFDLIPPDNTMLARSNRIAFRIVDG